jgi:glycosyltransferase involved in cell wall biosynthesis
MKLSIITVNLNNRDGLLKTLNSVLSQSFTDFEWIVIDGGSTDGSKELLEHNNDKIDYWVSEEDAGIYNAMNKGTMLAKGDFCQYLNSGDYYVDENVLANVFEKELSGDVNYGDVYCVTSSGLEHRQYPEEIGLPFLLKAPLGHQAAFIRAELAKTNLYKERYTISADRAFFLDAYCLNRKFHHLDMPIVYFDVYGIGSRPESFTERAKQFKDIKSQLFASQVLRDIDKWMYIEEEFSFVMRVWPIRFVYQICKKIKSWRDSILKIIR